MTRRALLLTAVAYTVIGVAAYARILHVGFLADDWMFLDLVSRAKNALVAFAPLNARFTRPLVVLVYYLNFRLFGLWTLPAHLIVVLLHIFNAWLLYVFVARLMPRPNQLAAAGAGLIFLLFAGHSETIAWVAGMADAAIVPFIIGSLLLLDGAIVRDRPTSRMALALMIGAAGLLAKETFMLLPAFALVYGVLPLHPVPVRQRLRRTLVFVAALTLVCAAYWLFRTARFASSGAAYSGMGLSEGYHLFMSRWFLVRTFLPPGQTTAVIVARRIDLLLIAGLAAGATWVALRRKRAAAGLAFLVIALVIALAPALPTSISLLDTMTERYVYLATAFSCALVASLLAGLAPRPAYGAAAILVFAALQLRYLERSNRSWVAEDAMFRSVVSGVLAVSDAHPTAGPSLILLLNARDVLYHPYMGAEGILPAVRLTSAARTSREVHARIVAMTHSPSSDTPVDIRQDGLTFTVDLGSATLVEDTLRDTAEYAVLHHDAHAFTIALQPPTRRILVAYMTRGHVELLTTIDGLPFGSLDLPAESTAVCRAPALRFSGWALDEEPGVTVELQRQDGATWSPIGGVAWTSGTRPDVASLYPEYPTADRAEWDYALPCSIVSTDRGVRVRAIARDRIGQQVTLGERLITR